MKVSVNWMRFICVLVFQSLRSFGHMSDAQLIVEGIGLLLLALSFTIHRECKHEHLTVVKEPDKSSVIDAEYEDVK